MNAQWNRSQSRTQNSIQFCYSVYFLPTALIIITIYPLFMF
jgi:hypothetical protein